MTEMENRHGLSELYSPRPASDAVAHVVFIHGLFGHPLKTWTWPKSRSNSPRPTKNQPSSSSSQGDNLRRRTEVQPKREDDYLASKDEAEEAEGEDEANSLEQHDEALRIPANKSGLPDQEYIFWPKALLPTVIPKARIFTWGYDADVDGLMSSASQNTIHEHANNLLVDLSDLRTTSSDRSTPLIFVAHSLGGIIVKEALNLSTSTEGTRWKLIAPAAFGIIFLGTPHKGSKSASMGRIAYQITTVATRRPNLKLLRGLEKNSETLDGIGNLFRQTVLRHKLRLCSFREEKETRKYMIFNTIVVTADSAKIGDAAEEVGSIPSNHSDMTKYKSLDDIGFRRVSSQLRRWIEEIVNEGSSASEDRDGCLRSLDIDEARLRMEEVREAHEKTFHWLFEPRKVPFCDWLRGDEASKGPIFWIQGKPGSGKSTLMKFGIRDPRTLDLLKSGRIGSWKLVAFFFHDRGSMVQKSLDGMMQEILHSILDQCPILLDVITPLYRKLVKSQRTTVPRWDTATLKKSLLTIAQERKPQVRLCLFLDALDEHGGDNEELAVLLKQMVAETGEGTVKIKICLASRPWSIFTKHFGNCPGFAIHEYTLGDISSYIKSRLTVDHHGSQHLLDQEQLLVIAAQVTEKSSGVFIWVRLVVDQLCKDIRDGTPFGNLETRVMKMPPELEDLYTHTLRRIDADYCDESYVMLQIALCSISPLPLQTFLESVSYNQKYFDSDIILGGLPPHLAELTSRVTKNTSLNSQLRRLASRTGGLLEAISSSPLSDAEGTRKDWQSRGYYVQFIHQTVKEYVRIYQHDLGLLGLSWKGQGVSGYLFLLGPNTGYSNKLEKSNLIKWIIPLRKDLLVYAKLFELCIDPDNISSLEIYFRMLDSISNDISKDDIGSWTPALTNSYFQALTGGLHYVSGDFLDNSRSVFTALAVTANLFLYISRLPSQRSSNLAYTFPERLPLLNLAVAGPDPLLPKDSDQCAMVEVLVKSGCLVNQKAHLLPPPDIESLLFQDLVLAANITPLACLLATHGDFNNRSRNETQLQIARTLLKLGADVDSTIYIQFESQIFDVSLLEYCIRFGTAPFVRLLLQHNASQKNGKLEYFAMLRNDEEIFQALKDHGVEFRRGVDRPPETARQALLFASHALGASLGRPFSGLFQRFPKPELEE